MSRIYEIRFGWVDDNGDSRNKRKWTQNLTNAKWSEPEEPTDILKILLRNGYKNTASVIEIEADERVYYPVKRVFSINYEA